MGLTIAAYTASGAPGSGAGKADMPSQINAARFGWPDLWQLWVAWRERRHVRACCVELLALYRQTAAGHPGLSGEPLYRAVVVAWLGLDGRVVDDVIQGAQVSYAHWPEERELRFRDVVHYLAVTGHGQSQGRKAWLRSSIAGVVEAEVPAGL